MSCVMCPRVETHFTTVVRCLTRVTNYLIKKMNTYTGQSILDALYKNHLFFIELVNARDHDVDLLSDGVDDTLYCKDES